MAQSDESIRVALVGAGFIADVHLGVLRRRRGVRVVALCDPAVDRAGAMARRHGVRRVYRSVAEMLAAGGVDGAHVLVPPHLHAEVAGPLVDAGLAVLVEKPLATTSAAARDLGARAEAAGCALGVNHSMVFHPCVQRLLADVESGRLGRLEHLSLVHHVPLRQLGGGEVGHFMFRSEANILLEQAVHPLSVVHRLLGPAHEVQALAGPARPLPTGEPFRDAWSLVLHCAGGTAQVWLAFGRALQESTLQAIGTDAVARIDLGRATYLRLDKTRWPDFWDSASNGLRGGAGLMRQGLRAASDYALGLFRLKRDADPFEQSMGASLDAFWDAAGRGAPPPADAAAGAEVVAMCEAAAQSAGVPRAVHPGWTPPEPGPAREGEVVVTGATGFLGPYVVGALRRAGHPVTVVVRRPELLPAALRDPELRVLRGDARDREAMAAAAKGARCVVHMATCAPGDGERAEDTMAEGVRATGEACVENGVERLVFVSSTAALYLGEEGVVTGATAPDPRPARRAEYARGKIAAEHELQRLRQQSGLQATVLRPAIVVGPGGRLDHSGVGLWVRDNHCVGWGMGGRPLPLVLARDVADAIAAAVSAPAVDGKAYNLAGDVRPTAEEYVALLRERQGRAAHFHPQPLWSMLGIEALKWGIKLAAGRRGALPARRDLRSRGFVATLDCEDAKRDLGWRPEADRGRFLQEVFGAGPGAGAAPARTAAP